MSSTRANAQATAAIAPAIDISGNDITPGDTGVTPSVRDRPRRRVRGKRAEAVNPAEAPRMKSGSWTETVYRVVVAADRLMTMDELRDALAKARNLEEAW